MRYGVRKKKELVLWGILCVGLILLYLLSSTDWIIKEKEVEVYPVSLIISNTSDDNYVNFRKGVDRAAVEYNVDGTADGAGAPGSGRRYRGSDTGAG